jgi:H+/Cl- antiporter ClcA
MPPSADPSSLPQRVWAALRQRAAALLRKGRNAANDIAPDFWLNLRNELLTGRQWLDRAVVLTYAVITGLVVVGFTMLSELAGEGFAHLRGIGTWGPALTLLWTPALTVALLWWTRRFAPAAAGSGIPQVILALDDDLPKSQRAWLVSLPLVFHKAGLVIGGQLAGLSIGREGPTVQMGAGVMDHAKRWLSKHTTIDAHDLMVAGAAAGIAATFNTPLGGIIFALEKLSRRRSTSYSALMIACIVLSGLVAISAFGNTTYFGQLSVQSLGRELLLPGMVVTLACGLAGGLFARLIVDSLSALPDRFSSWRRSHPYHFGAACALGVAVIGVATGGATAGAGYAPTRALLEGHGELPGVYTLLKFCATWLSTWSGVPGGMFAPSLSIGAGIGHDVALAAGLSREAAIPLIALGMVGFLAASTQAPITAFIIVMEMVSGHAMVLSLMACSMIASGVGRLVSKPMYTELAARLKLPPAVPEPSADPNRTPTTP